MQHCTSHAYFFLNEGMADLQSKKAEYLRLLGNLPQINYNILKKLICHLNAVHELSENNLMPLVNLAPIWGPTLMNVDVREKILLLRNWKYYDLYVT